MNSKMFFSFVLILSLISINLSLAQNKREIQISNEFSLNLLQTLSNEDNTFFSSPSLINSLLSLQPKDQTKEDIKRLLDLKSDADLNEINSEIKSLLNKLDEKNSKDLNIKLLTKILVKQNNNNNNKNSLEVNFKEDSKLITKQLNQWIQEKSSGSITRLFKDNLDKESEIVLANVNYFNGKFKLPFIMSSPRDFKNFISYQMPGLPTRIPFIETKGLLKSKTYPEIRSRLIEIPYQNNNFSMIMIIPTKQEDLEFLNENMTLTQLTQSMNDLNEVSPKFTRLIIPKFKLDLEYDLKDSLENSFELSSLFGEHAQLFDRQLKVSPAIHKSIIEVNNNKEENETTINKIEEELIVESPFVFLIRDKTNELIVFMGRVQTLVNEELIGLGFI